MAGRVVPRKSANILESEPRKGTETLALFERIDGGILESEPRKGTETSHHVIYMNLERQPPRAGDR